MLVVKKQIPNPRVRFTPEGMRSARRKYDNGDPRQLITMMKLASEDSHVEGCLIGRRSGYKRQFSLTSYDDTDTDTERRDWLHGVLQRLRIRDLLESIHEGRLYLYSVIDFEYDVVDGRQVPVSFEAFDQRHFRRDREGELKVEWGPELRDIPDTALVVEVKRPAMLPVLRDYILKEFGLEAWSSFLEVFGEPFLLGKYPPGSDAGFKKQVEDGLNAMARSARGIAPDGTEVEVIETSRSTGDHEQYVDRADKGIAIALLGHANAVEQAPGLQVGQNLSSYEVRHELAVDDMYWLEQHVNSLIQTIWDRNFSDARYPQFELNKARPVAARDHIEVIDTAWRHGLKVHPDEYRKVGLYVYDDQEPIQRKATELGSIFE